MLDEAAQMNGVSVRFGREVMDADGPQRVESRHTRRHV
jgi:hypothetical protein